MGLVPRIKVVVDVEVPGNLYPRAAITVDHSQVSIISGLLLSQPDWIDAVRYLYQIMKKKRLLVAKCRRYLNIKNDAGSGPSFPPMPGLFLGGGLAPIGGFVFIATCLTIETDSSVQRRWGKWQETFGGGDHGG